MTDIHNSAKRLEATRQKLAKLQHEELLLRFLDHLQALGLSTSRVLKYATQLCILYENTPFDPAAASRTDAEKAVA
jgi:antitoxin component of RelBE/YafQ-DinJ toxin-antitoxin module